jgi:hypothetical protein
MRLRDAVRNEPHTPPPLLKLRCVGSSRLTKQKKNKAPAHGRHQLHRRRGGRGGRPGRRGRSPAIRPCPVGRRGGTGACVGEERGRACRRVSVGHRKKTFPPPHHPAPNKTTHTQTQSGLCTRCRGSGTQECALCYGRGSLAKPGFVNTAAPAARRECPRCGGEGRHACNVCGGGGGPGMEAAVRAERERGGGEVPPPPPPPPRRRRAGGL